MGPLSRALPSSAAAFVAAASCSACSDRSPFSTSVGVLAPGSTMHVRIVSGSVTAYAPAAGDPSDRFTVSATATSEANQTAPPSIRPLGKGIEVSAGTLETLLVRVPHGVDLAVDSSKGDVSATNIDGNVDVRAASGSVRVMVPGYARAAVGKGNLNVTMGATSWPVRCRFRCKTATSYSSSTRRRPSTFGCTPGTERSSRLQRARNLAGHVRNDRRGRQRRRPATHRRRSRARQHPAPEAEPAALGSRRVPRAFRSASFAFTRRTIASLYGVGVPGAGRRPRPPR